MAIDEDPNRFISAHTSSHSSEFTFATESPNGTEGVARVKRGPADGLPRHEGAPRLGRLLATAADERAGRSDQAGTTTTRHDATRATCDDTLPRSSRRRFVRPRDPRTITSAASEIDASRMVSAGSPSQTR